MKKAGIIYSFLLNLGFESNSSNLSQKSRKFNQPFINRIHVALGLPIDSDNTKEFINEFKEFAKSNTKF